MMKRLFIFYLAERKGSIILAFLFCILLSFGKWSSLAASGKPGGASDQTIQVGIARADITPNGPIMLAGYEGRKKESEGVLQKIWAKAMAFGSAAQGPSVIITVELVGIPDYISSEVARRVGLDPAHIVIASDHIHTGPEVGTLLNHFGRHLPPKQLGHIIQYVRQQLIPDLERVARSALQARRPVLVSWGTGEVGFAKNRRPESDIRPVDHSMPMLRVTDPDGKLKGIWVNYACHAVANSGSNGHVNKIHGDWVGEAGRIIEERHPGAMAMVSIGAGGDANPDPMGKIKYATLHGREIADEVDSLLSTSLKPLTTPPVGRYKRIELPYAHVPTVEELVRDAQKYEGNPHAPGDRKGYYARLALGRWARGQPIPTSLSYPVQTWTFGDDLAMVFLAGEPVVDYTLRLKKELTANRLWVVGYANEVPCYIGSARVIREGGYEAKSSMPSYNRPSPFVPEIEDLIVRTVHQLLPASFKTKKVSSPTTHPKVVRQDNEGILHLRANVGRSVGPDIQYMPEWKAFGWFTEKDRVEWWVEVKKEGTYGVYLTWSVSDEEAGKPFVFKAEDQQIQGTISLSGSWERYKTEKIGTIQLSAGHQKMIFKPESEAEKGPLLDLRELKLFLLSK